MIVDYINLEFAWNKYSKDKTYMETSENSTVRLDHAKWLDIYLNYNENRI